MQEQQLPVPKVGMRQQLGLWASQAAAVRAGNLQLSCELTGLRDLGPARLSPHADCVAACATSGARNAVLIPVTSTQHDLRSEVGVQQPSQTLTQPGAEPGRILELWWSSTDPHLAVVSLLSRPLGPQQVSTFRGAQLVGSFLEPVGDGGCVGGHVHLADDAATMLLTLISNGGVRVVACTPQGAVTARHPSARFDWSTACVDSGRILRAASAGDRLFVCSSSCVQEVPLQRDPAPYWDAYSAVVSCWGGLATVLLMSKQEELFSDALLFVSLVRQAVQLSVQPALAGCSGV